MGRIYAGTIDRDRLEIGAKVRLEHGLMKNDSGQRLVNPGDWFWFFKGPKGNEILVRVTATDMSEGKRLTFFGDEGAFEIVFDEGDEGVVAARKPR